MTKDVAVIVRALVDLSRTVPDGEAFLRDVRDQLSRHVRDADQTLAVTLITPSGNEPELAKAVTNVLQKKYNRPLELRERRNSSLLGGAILQIGDEQIDLSVRGALNALDMKLRTTPLSR